MYKGLGFIVFWFLLFASISVKAQPFRFTSNRSQKKIAFKFVKNLIIIPLEINGKGPFNFILDSGVGPFIITDPVLKDSLNIQSLRTIAISGLGEGPDINAWVAPKLDLSLLNIIKGSVSAAIFKEDFFNLSNFTGIAIHGLVGYDLFSSFKIKINYQQSEITIYTNKSQYYPKKSIGVPITIEGRKPYINSQIIVNDGKEVTAKLLLDTGAGHPLSLESDSGQPFSIPQKNIPANLGVGLAGAINGRMSRISFLRLGNYRLSNVVCAFPNERHVAEKLDSLTNRNGSIGNAILKRFEIMFDYDQNVLYLKPNSLLKQAFEHDMSGIELITAGQNYSRIFIERVEEGSAAQLAGLQQNDELLTIDHKPVQEIGLQQIQNMFSSRHGRSIKLGVISKSSKTPVAVVLTLQRRI